MKRDLFSIILDSKSSKVTEPRHPFTDGMLKIHHYKCSEVGNKFLTSKFLWLKSLFIIFFLFLSVRARAPGINVTYIFASEPIALYDRLIKAVIQVESMGDTLACNQTEEAIGAFQIRPIRLVDYNQRTGNNYKLEDCYNFEISKKIFLYYAKRIGYPDYESIAKKWNGSGKNTLDYWEKVKTFL